MSKTVRNIREPLKKPRPLRTSSVEQPKEDSLTPKARADLLSELEILNVRISNCDLKEAVTADISHMCSLLKKHGEDLESGHKDAMDRYFSTLRNACREDRLDVLSRLRLLEVIEMRAMHWKMNENFSNYFSSRYSQLEETCEHQNMPGSISPSIIMNPPNQNLTNVGALTLAPGEFLRSSGKFSKPTKIAGKNYFKDEIVIRNCDSGKVMGIKGRRVHMIEELSDTVISFQRGDKCSELTVESEQNVKMNAGARDRLVQITGPHEEAISHAKYLVEDTIKRNVSPVRENLGLLELDNKDHLDFGNTFFDQSSTKRNLTHSYSMSDASTREFSVSVHIGQDVVVLTGTKPDVLKTAKNVLVEYFSGQVDTCDKDSPMLPLSKSASLGNNNQRFALQKQVSLKDNVPSSFSSTDLGISRRSSSSSWSSDELLPEKDSSDQETSTMPLPNDVPIPPPSYPSARRHTYSRRFLLECAQLPLSQKVPHNYEHFTSSTPEIKPQVSPVVTRQRVALKGSMYYRLVNSVVKFDSLQYLQEHP